MQMTTIEQKRLLRARLRIAERELTEDYKRRADAEIIVRLLSMPEYVSAGTVFAFVGTARETDTSALLRDALRSGKRLCVPLCGDKGIMELKELKSLELLTPGAFGILEPPPELPSVSPESVELAVVPCLGCSRAGRRLGRGGGYYDRFLERYKGPAAMLCREALILEDIPTEAHDVPISIVITENGVFR